MEGDTVVIHKLKQDRFRSDIRKNFLHWEQSSCGTGYLEGLCIQFPIFGSFKGLNGYSHERSDLTLELTMLWAGGWTRSLLRCLPIWIILWSCEKASFCMLEQTDNSEREPPHHMVVWIVNSNSTGGTAGYYAHGLLFLGILVQRNRHKVFMLSWKPISSHNWMVPHKHLVCVYCMC